MPLITRRRTKRSQARPAPIPTISRAEYDAKVEVARSGHDFDLKRRVLALLGELESSGLQLTGRMLYTQQVLTTQLAADARRDAGDAEKIPTRNHRPLGR